MNQGRNRNKRSIKTFLTGSLLTLVIVFSVQARTTDAYFEISKNLDIFTNIFKELNANYVDPIAPGELIKTGIDAMLKKLDPYTVYITESDIEEFEFQTTGKYGGIGATMRKNGDTIRVGEVYEYSPAHKAGLHPGDRLLSIDKKSVVGKSISDISVLLKGSPGTQINIQIKDAYTGGVMDKVIIRGEIEVSSVPYAGFVGSKNDIAYVRLTQFTHGCSRLVKSALDSLKKVNPNMQSVLLDLRNNPGGLLNEAVSTCNLFINRGQLVVSTKGKRKEIGQNFNTTSKAWDTNIPVAVLINRSSASASEIVSGTIQDLDRGVVIGERSYGKGLVQTTRPLGYNARLKLTTAKYYTPSGRCIQALDYTHRNADGSVGHVPDSLKKEYKTKNGRKVLSGGGVEPDIDVENKEISQLAVTLYMKGYIFDYATQYAKQHQTIGNPASFKLTDAEFNTFSKWLEDKDYSYKTETEVALDSLTSVAKREKRYDNLAASFEALEKKLAHNKKDDLEKYKTEVRTFLENEIVSRYYYLRGRISHSLTDDKYIAQAVKVLDNSTEYKNVLQSK